MSASTCMYFLYAWLSFVMNLSICCDFPHMPDFRSITAKHLWWYGDGAGNTVEENSSVFSLIRMRYLPSVLSHCWMGGRKGIWPVKNMGGWCRWALVSLDGVALSQMVSVSASVNLPCTIKSRSSLLAPAHPGGPGKRAVKGVVVVVQPEILQDMFGTLSSHIGSVCCRYWLQLSSLPGYIRSWLATMFHWKLYPLLRNLDKQ